MKHLYLVFMFVAVLSSSALASTHTLYSDRNLAIGTVETTFLAGVLLVRVRVTLPGWCLIKSHLYVGTARPEMSAPGNFPYQHELRCSLSDAYMIDVGPGRHYVAYYAESVETSFAGVNDLQIPLQQCRTARLWLGTPRPAAFWRASQATLLRG